MSFSAFLIAMMTFSIDKRAFSYYFLIFSNVLFFYFVLIYDSEFSSQYLVLERDKKILLLVMPIVNIFFMLLLGGREKKQIGIFFLNSIIIFSSYIMLGAVEFSLFFVSLSIPFLISNIIVIINNDLLSTFSAFKNLVIGFIELTLLMVAIILFYISTESLNFYDFKIIYPLAYYTSIVIFIFSIMNILGLSPFSLLSKENFIHSKNDTMFTNMIILRVPLIIALLAVLHKLILVNDVEIQAMIFNIIVGIIVINILITSMKNLLFLDLKLKLMNIFVDRISWVFLIVCLPINEHRNIGILLYLFVNTISFVIPVYILNKMQINGLNVNIIDYKKQYIIRDKKVAFLLAIFLFNLASVPFTAGFAVIYFLFAELLKASEFYVVGVLLFSFIVANIGVLKSSWSLFFKDTDVDINEITVNINLKEKFIFSILLLIVFFIGISTFLIFK
jgi:NADH:ubiquinone oxidoreductase subunit 2 (subunit N)